MARINLLLIPLQRQLARGHRRARREFSLVFGNIAQSLPQVKAGRLRALGVYELTPLAGDARRKNHRGIGRDGFDTSTWYGMLAPAGTPRTIVEKINGEIVRVLQLPDVRERFGSRSVRTAADTPDQFAAIIKGEMSRWAKLVKETALGSSSDLTSHRRKPVSSAI